MEAHQGLFGGPINAIINERNYYFVVVIIIVVIC